MDHIDRKKPALCIILSHDLSNRVDFGIGGDADQWDPAVCGMFYFVNILINILTPILHSLYEPNHQGQHMQRTDERTRENKSPHSLL